VVESLVEPPLQLAELLKIAPRRVVEFAHFSPPPASRITTAAKISANDLDPSEIVDPPRSGRIGESCVRIK
jgi:hypothetical protein